MNSTLLKGIRVGFVALILGLVPVTPAAALCLNEDDPLQVFDFYIDIDASDWNAILHDTTFNDERPAMFSCGDEVPMLVSVRRKRTIALPGEGSPVKVSLKIDVNEYVVDQEWHTLRKISLENGGEGDLIEEGLAWILMARAGAITRNGTWVTVHVNGSKVGVYARVEQVDKAFLRHHLNEDEWFLFKGTEQRTRELESDPFESALCYTPFDNNCSLPPDGYGGASTTNRV